ncbi:cobalt ABC transporter permease [Clostridium sp. C2-6-12]|uniref:cobalt ABC transporter permease n=1 Tax=Clostridium sp. C2-6-12 TaxID=2698832 RepID=UPI00136EAB4F|nr:cobalt ABC transporter permease [Clostridium sp. C2-6-12]
MKEVLISQIAPIAATAITAILCVVIKNIGKAGIELFAAKKKEVEQRIENNGYKSTLDKALEVWRIVDDKFRLTQNAKEVFGSKENLFEQILIERIPGLTQKNIDDIRDTVSGIVNEGRQALTEDSKTQQLEELKQVNTDLQKENEELKSKINNIQAYVADNVATLIDTQN